MDPANSLRALVLIYLVLIVLGLGFVTVVMEIVRLLSYIGQ